jgi:hypothetical protein
MPQGADISEWADKNQGRMGQPPWADVRCYLDNAPYNAEPRAW